MVSQSSLSSYSQQKQTVGFWWEKIKYRIIKLQGLAAGDDARQKATVIFSEVVPRYNEVARENSTIT